MFNPLFRRSAPFPLVLGCSRPLVGVDAESSEVVQETPRPLFSCSLPWPPTQPAPPTNFTNTTHFGSLVSSMRATNPANKIRLLYKVALTSRLDKRVQIGNRVVGAIVLSPTDAASQEPVVRSAQRVVVARARASRDAAVRHYLENLGS